MTQEQWNNRLSERRTNAERRKTGKTFIYIREGKKEKIKERTKRRYKFR